MPNGGVPMNMVIRPRGSSIVIECRGAEVRIFDRAQWETGGAEPIAELSTEDAGALAWFLAYWAGEKRVQPGYRREGFDFDY